MAPGRQRTLSTKQQILCKSPVLLLLVVVYLIYPPIEQEKAGKVKAAKDKAYQEAVRSQQRQEEIIGFQKVPAQAPQPSQGKAHTNSLSS